MSLDRLPPAAPDAERGVLGCCIAAPQSALGDAREQLGPEPEVFYDLRHRCLWTELLAMDQARLQIDDITLAAHLDQRGLIDQCGGRAYISEHQDLIPSADNLSHYTKIVRDKYLLRAMLKACTEGVAEIYDSTLPAQEVLDGIERAVLRTSEARITKRARSMKELMIEVGEQYIDKFVRGRKLMLGLSTGFNYFDSMVPGLAPGDYIVIGARPSMGKTALAMQIAQWHALVLKLPVHVFSMEMTDTALALRQLFQHAGANLHKFSDGFLSLDAQERLTASAPILAKDLWTIDDSSRCSIEDIEIRARRLRRERRVAAFYIDYLQLLGSRRQRQWHSRNDELADVSARIKSLAKELQVPFILMAQLNREIEKEVNRRPRMSDLRECGNIEQDADVVTFLYRPKIDPDADKDMKFLERLKAVVPSDPYSTEEDGNWCHPTDWKKFLTRVNWAVVKQRNGPTGDCAMVFVKPWMRFVDAFNPAGAAEPKESAA